MIALPNFDSVLLINFSNFVYFDTFVIDVKGGEIRENCILYIVSYIGGVICKGEYYRIVGEIRDINIVKYNWRDKDVNTSHKHK